MTERQPPAAPILVTAALQSACLYVIYRALDDETTLATLPALYFPLFALATAVALAFMLLVQRADNGRLLRDLAVVALLVCGLGAYLGYQLQPVEEIEAMPLTWVAVCCLFLALFKTSAYLRARMDGERFDYPTLFAQSWRSFLVPALAAGMSLLLLATLLLAAALFDTIGIGLFDWLLERAWFNFPVFGITFGVGVLTFRRLDSVLAGITQLLRGLMTLLLPIVVLVTVGFLASLPFTGLAPLWGTGNGTALVLWLLAFVLFFVNAVYQHEVEGTPYPAFAERALRYGLVVVPLLSPIALWGLWLRIDQYGISVSRCWALVAALVLSAFAFGYAAQILRLGARWRAGLADVNRFMGLAIIAVLVLASSPILDFRKLSVASQLARLDAGTVAPEDFDYRYLRELAKPGWRAEHALRERFADDAELLAQIDRETRGYRAKTGDDDALTERFWAAVNTRPEDLAVPDGLRQAVTDHRGSIAWGKAYLLQVDADADAAAEYLFVDARENGVSATLFDRRGGQWHSVETTAVSTVLPDVLRQQLEHGDVETVAPPYRDIIVGGLRVHMIDRPRMDLAPIGTPGTATAMPENETEAARPGDLQADTQADEPTPR